MDYLNSTVNNMLPWVMDKGIHILWAITFFIVGWWLINKSRKFIIIFMQRANLESGVITFLDSLSKLSLRIILVLVLLPHIGIDTSSIVTTLGVSLAAIGLALKDSLANIASGILMVVYNPFHVGDHIEVDGVSGTVTKVEMMFTTLMSDSNKVIIIPNSKLTSESIVRTSDYNIECCKLEYDVDGGATNDSIKKIVQRSIALNDNVLQIPPLEIIVKESTESVRHVEVVFWTEKANQGVSITSIDELLRASLTKHKLKLLENSK